jgi:hypothetical protein
VGPLLTHADNETCSLSVPSGEQTGGEGGTPPHPAGNEACCLCSQTDLAAFDFVMS